MREDCEPAFSREQSNRENEPCFPMVHPWLHPAQDRLREREPWPEFNDARTLKNRTFDLPIQA